MNNAVMFSHNSDEWETPQKIFDELNNEFDFNLDPCATDENHKTPNYFTKENSGLSHYWGGAESSATRHTHKLAHGLKRLTKKVINPIPSWSF